MKRIFAKYMAIIGILCVLAGETARAADANIVEVHVMDSQLTAYVKGVEKTDSAGAMLGKYAVDGASCKTMDDVAVKTLLLVDNSISIPQESRAAIKEQLLELVAARKSMDYFAVGTISEAVNVTQAFTNDYATLKTAIESIEHQDQETYITDALYDYLAVDPFAQDSKDSFIRILLISDGVDNKSIGYTAGELLTLLKGNPMPIYTVGVENGKSENPGEIENMFSLSRATGAECCLFKDLSGSAALTNMMESDRNNLSVAMEIPEEVQDGSQQTLTLTLGGTSVSIDGVRMPQSLKAPEPEQVPVPGPDQAPDSDSNLKLIIIIAAAILALLLIIGIVVTVILVSKSKKNKNDFQSFSEEELRKRYEQENGATVMADSATEMSDDVRDIWGSGDGPACMITLTDVHSPERRYQKRLSKSLIIGFSRDSDICINYDKSVSRKHCELIREEDDVYIVNHSTSNGTLVNGNRVTSKLLVFDKSVIKMGRVEMRLEIN